MLHKLTATTLLLFILCLGGRPKNVKSFVMLQKLAASPKTQTMAIEVFMKNPNNYDDETPEEKEERMKLVRKIQASFYKDDDKENPLVQKVVVDSSSEEADSSSDCFQNVPLFRVQWTELPGYQNLLNIHVPHYTHMFRRIINGPKPWRFGHVYLPDGSENLSNPEYQLLSSKNKATRIGTLMEISDVMEDQNDGRLGLIVQAIEKFQILGEATQQAPYTIATVQLTPDKEEYTSSSKTMQDFEEWTEWEVRPTMWKDKDENGNLNISPLVNYNSDVYPDELALLDVDKQQTLSSNILDMEYRVWVALDEMLVLLRSVSGLEVPVPSQLLGLLPTQPLRDWPKSFQLEAVASRLESTNAQIGTFTKSPFVRVSLCETYPSLRRAKRLSYAIWVLLDVFMDSGKVGDGDKLPIRQHLLQMNSVADRLSAAYSQMETINLSLRKSLPPR